MWSLFCGFRVRVPVLPYINRMNEQNTQKLFQDFPTFFRPEKGPQQTLMCFGFECDDGWFNLIYKLCEDIRDLNPPEGFEVIQVKEKFGGLRFYADNTTKEIYDRINEAEAKSEVTCESCGADNPDGIQSYRGWYSSFCLTCAKPYIIDEETENE